MATELTRARQRALRCATEVHHRSALLAREARGPAREHVIKALKDRLDIARRFLSDARDRVEELDCEQQQVP